MEFCRTSLAILALLTMTACADRPSVGEAPSARFPERDARVLFEDGYEFISARFVEPVPIERLALSGLARAGELASDVTIRRVEGNVQVAVRGQPPKTIAAPDARDYRGWAEVSALALRTAWDGSPSLREKDPDDIYTAVFQGALSRLDTYSLYLSPKLADDDKATREGFGGIGVRLKTDDGRALIEAVTPDSPAARAGLRDGDEIVAADGVVLSRIDRKDIPKRLRGQEGTVVTVDMLRPSTGERFTRQIIRSFVIAQSVFGSLEGDVAILRVETFNAATFDEMAGQLSRLRQSVPRLGGIIIDLRNNAGGHLDQAAKMADFFVDSGALLTVRGRHPASYRHHEATGRDYTGGLPLAILVNSRSASASEMLAASLQDLGRAVVIGATTFGKGSVQVLHFLPNRAELRVTWARMYAPSGYVLDRLGVLPGICTSDHHVDPIEFRQGGRRDLSEAFAEWHRYDTVDPVLARTLRQRCPSSETAPESDVALAERVLHDHALYVSALRPGIRSNLARVER